MASKKLATEVVEVLRLKNKELVDEINSLKLHLRESENQRFKLEQTSVKAQDDSLVLYEAIRVLAGVIGNETGRNRAARKEARELLTRAEISPPSALGKSRERKSKRRRKRLDEGS